MIDLSPSAIGEVKRLRSKQLFTEEGFLRIDVCAGGCSGWSYQLKFTQSPGTEDQVFDCGEIQVVVDPQSLAYVNGLRLDYTEDLMGGGFRFHNPRATATCTCGHSFAI